MGAVVTKDVPAGETWVGNPAKLMHVPARVLDADSADWALYDAVMSHPIQEPPDA
jgi:acetyltransferase-like isoleucine patch superfamily enzyme